MADNKVTIDLQIASKGMDPAVQKSQAIRDNLTAAGGAMSRTSGGGGTAGSRAVSEKAAGQEYAAQRGVAGATGASARNFAAESQGLGGLVRLYATVAANTYAAAAAFTALSKAMDTSNMIKGLDQLGAASGVALGSLSKRLYQSTDGAVSLREAMEATVKASSAGLNTDQILQLGDVAKKASQALGLDMADALSRLSRGISKIEPELLDELGIFVKIDEAASKYALSVGKSTSALTDFERRQAFANAVLEQGTKKFGEINIDTNPYTKLAATFQNLVQSGLELVNKVLGPIARVLADNSVLLGAAVVFLASKILKMAVPALSQWQEELVKTANVAKDKAQAINTAFGEAWVQRWENRLKLPELRQGVQAATAELGKLGLPAAVTKNVGEGYAALLKGEELSKTQVTSTKLAITSKKKEIEALGEIQDRNSKKQAAALQKEIIQLETIIALNAKRVQLNVAEETIGEKAGKQPGFFSGDASRDRRAKGASTTAIAYAELAAIPGQTMEKGFMDAMKGMKANLDKQGVGFIKKWSTMAVGALASATTAIGLFAASVQMWIAAFAIVGTVIYGVIKYFSATKKESDLTSESLTRLEDTSKNAALTLERLGTLNPLERLSVESIQARANALKELGDSGALAVKRAFDEINKMNIGDKFLNWVSKLWGGDVQTKLSEGLSDSLKNAFKLAEDTQLTADAKKSIESILGASIQSADLDKTIKSLANSGQDEKLKQVVKIIEKMGNAAAVSAAKGTELKESIKKVTSDIQEFNKSILPTDNLSKIAQDSSVAAQKLGLALADPVQALTAMRDVSGSVDLLSIFPADVAKNLMSYNSELTSIATRVANAKDQTAQYDKEITNLDKSIKKLGTGGAGINTGALVQQYKQQISAIEDKKLQLKAEIETDTSKIKGVFDQAVRSSLIQSADLMAARLAAEMNKAKTAVLGAMAGLLGDSVGGIKLRMDLEKQAIDANLEVTKQSFNLANKLEELKVEMERRRLLDERSFLETKKTQGLITSEEEGKLGSISDRLKNLDKLDVIFKGKNVTSSQALVRQGADSDVVAAQQKAEAFRVSLSGGAAQKSAIDLKGRYEIEKAEFEIKQKDFQLTIDQANTEKERAAILSNIYGIENQGLVNAKIASENTAQQLTDEKARNVLVQATDQKASLYLQMLKEASSSGKALTKDQEKQLDYFKDALMAAGAEVDRFDKSLELRKQLKAVNDEILRESSKSAATAKEVEFQEILLKNESELAKSKLDNRKQEFDALVSAGRISEEYAAIKTAEFAKENQAIVYQSQLREATAVKDAAFRASLSKATQAQLLTGDPEAGSAVMAEEQARANLAYAERIKLIESTNTGALRSIDITKTHNLELIQQKAVMDSLVLTTESLAAVFGTVGEAIGAVAQALQKSADSEKQNLAARIALEAQLEAAKESKDPKALANVNKAIADQDKKSAKDKLNNDIALLNSSKKMFKEKTVAYKALDAIEKVQHVRRIFESNKELITSIMNAGKELATKLGFMATEETAQVSFRASEIAGTAAANAANATSAIPAIFAKFSAMMGPWGWAAAAAVVAALGLKGGSKSPPAGFTAEEQQKVQGTGQMYEGGKLVDRAGGVLGDRTAKAKSVGDSIDELSKVFFEVLGSDSSKMLGYLRGIEENTLGLAKALTGSATGVLGDKPLGIGESSRGSGLAGFLFGKSKTSIADQGIEVTGSLEKLSQGIGNFSAYVNTVTKSSGFLGFGGGTRYNTTRDKVETTAVDAIAKIFKNVQGVLVTAAESLEGSGMRVTEVLRDIPIKIKASAKDLSAKEFAEAVQAEISVALNAAAEKAFPYMSEYVRVGEEYWTTVARVNKEGEVLNQGLKMIGLSIIKAAEGTIGMEAAATRVAAQQNLLKAFSGDLDAATSSIQFYFDNFLTEQERSTYYTEQLTTGFKDLGMATVPTLEQFTKMVAGLDANDEAQANTLASLLKLAPAYDKLRQAQEKTSQLQEDLWTLEGKGAQALEAQRARELRSMSAVDAALQRRINALEDEKSAYDKLRGALKETVEGIKTSVTGLRDARNSLLTGPDSFMTPQQRLETQKSQYTTALAAARGPLDTPEQRKTAQTAAQTATRLLQEIKTSGDVLFASGQENVDLRAWLAQTAGETADILEASQVGFEEQIASIDAGTNVLKSVDSTLTSIKTLWADYITAQTVTAEAPVNQAPATTQAPNSVADAQVASAMLQVAVQKETNKLLQQQLELQAEQLRSNAIAMKAQTDELNRAAEERRLAAEYAERNKPSFGYASGDGA